MIVVAEAGPEVQPRVRAAVAHPRHVQAEVTRLGVAQPVVLEAAGREPRLQLLQLSTWRL